MQRIHIIPHTHWDREWYKPFQYFRVKLVYVIDNLLEILEKDDSFSNFLLDGQTIVLEDYLQIKPENLTRLKKLIEDNRIQVGPWYVLPDEFAPDGESLVRNLLIGINISQKFGKPMMVGYLPDSFGHSGQMPHILRGFGISSSVVMRGVDAEAIKSSEFTWRGENGNEVLSIYLPHGYSNGMFLPKGYRENKFRLQLAIRNMRKWASTSNVLIMNGVDHQFPQEQIADHIKQLNKKGKKTYFISTLDRYLADVINEKPELPVLSGDLLTPSRNRVHSSIASTRIYQKQKNRRMEALLEKYVEPITTIAWLNNADYPSGLINQAWKYLIQNQTHDGICGCCLDEVHREMDQRFVDVKNIGETLQNTFARAIAHKISGGKLHLVVFNNSLTKGNQIVRANIYTKKKNFSIKDSAGNPIPYQIIGTEEVDIAEKSIWTLYLKSKERTQKTEIIFSANFDFNVGYKVYSINEGGKNPGIKPGVTIIDNIIENEYLKVEINKNGSINLIDKQTGQLYDGLHVFEDCGDAGDTYNFSPVKNDTVISSRENEASYVISRKGPQSVEVTIYYELSIPTSLINQDQDRSQEKVIIPITTRMTIYANQKRLEFSTEIDNKADDHRLRVLFPAGINSDFSYAESQFGIIKRKNKLTNEDWKKRKWHEKPLPIYSQQRFVDLNDGKTGLAVLNRGLSEYEIYKKSTSTIAITLLRGVGMMGKADLLIRPGRPSGITTPTPDAQCHGIHVLEYSLFPHSGDTGTENIPKRAAEFDAYPLAVQSHLQYKRLLKKFKLLLKYISLETFTGHIFDQLGVIGKDDLELITITDERLIISAVKKSEEENALLVRFYNPNQLPVGSATIHLGVKAEVGYITDLNEKILEEMDKLESGEFLIPEIKPNTSLTIKFLIPR